MTIEQLLFALGGLSISIISFFLRRTLNQLEKVKEVTYDNKAKIEIIHTDYINKVSSLNQRMDMLYNSIEKLSDKIDQLNKNIK
jgi:hypothetical protein